MDKPTLTDYVRLIFTLFEQFEQQEMNNNAKVGSPLLIHRNVSLSCLSFYSFVAYSSSKRKSAG